MKGVQTKTQFEASVLMKCDSGADFINSLGRIVCEVAKSVSPESLLSKADWNYFVAPKTPFFHKCPATGDCAVAAQEPF